jgi:hypothetical protein
MKYRAAFELIDAGLIKAELGFPPLEGAKKEFFNAKVQEVGLRADKKKNSESFTTTATNSYTFTNTDVTSRIYKVQLDTKLVPFVSEKRYTENLDESLVDNIGFFYKETVTGPEELVRSIARQIIFTKNTEAGKTLKVSYYASPVAYTDLDSYIDLPDQLIPSALHYALGHFLALDGQMKLASGHRGLARQIEQEYIQTINTREAKPDIIPLPLQDFL